MKNKRIQNLFFLILLITISVIFFSSLNRTFIKSEQDTTSLKTASLIKIWTEDDLKNELKMRVDEKGKFQIEEINNPQEAEYILTTDEKNVPIGFEKNSIYQRTLELNPQSFQEQFKEKVPSELKIILGFKKNLNPEFRSQLEESFQKNPPEEISIVAVGDILPSRNVAQKMDQNGVNYPFLKTSLLTKQSDLTIGNLESPFSDSGKKIKEGTVFNAEPEYIKGIKNAGFDALSLANNHFGDQGKNGMIYTFKLLKDNGIYYYGAGENSTEAHSPYLTEVKGVKFAILGYNDSDVAPASYQATSSSPGSAFMNIQNLKNDLKSIREKADFVIVSMHSGTEYTPNPNQSQISFSKAAIENGADVVVGHHPHVVQAINYYQNKFIFYSLGNFVFDQMWSQETREGLILKLKISLNHIVEVELDPVLISDFAQPEVIKGEPAEKILSRIYQAFQKLNK